MEPSPWSSHISQSLFFNLVILKAQASNQMVAFGRILLEGIKLHGLCQFSRGSILMAKCLHSRTNRLAGTTRSCLAEQQSCVKIAAEVFVLRLLGAPQVNKSALMNAAAVSLTLLEPSDPIAGRRPHETLLGQVFLQSRENGECL